jgi:hypothetical protein
LLFKVPPYESRFCSNTLEVDKMNKQNLEVNFIRERRLLVSSFNRLVYIGSFIQFFRL